MTERKPTPPPPTPARATYLCSNDLDADHWTDVESEEEARQIAKENQWTTLFIDDAVRPDASRFLEAQDIAERLEEYIYENYHEPIYESLAVPPDANEQLRALLLPWVKENMTTHLWVCAGNPRELDL